MYIDDITNAQRAEVLTAALPYIRKYYGKIIVVKYGGNAMTNEALKDAVMSDIVLLSLVGVKVVLVHGGGGHDFMDATEEAFVGAMAAHMKHGTTSIVPTTLTICPPPTFSRSTAYPFS